ncbi:MAG: bifunctional 5,10-methylenetetrahydrofolate dehydrogenase/5,10-methenyltetrahydrofolate cyclohydrolase [Candidatus Yanofskybacteria bacterium]|nr:bifunctional 5,10-methylenetetrahydrofolate dehydrogenase/5,10-methenyltetrahydrofolate cyclohydrolase [Candidatus Yanofskybacteria bacterium]
MIIDGKKIAEEILMEVSKEVKKLPKQPRLVAVLVGSNPDVEPRDSLEAQPLSGLRKFLELKKKAAEKVGIDFRLYEFQAEITTQKLRKEIVSIAKAGVNQGVLIELPLPAHINTQYILNAILSEKDVDVLSEKSQGSFFARPEAKLLGVGRSAILPPAVEAVKIIFEKYGTNPKGKNCVVFGYGLLIGKPISHWLASQGATVSIINEFTPNPAELSHQADIIISGVGPVRESRQDSITSIYNKLGPLALSNGTSPEDRGVATSNGTSKPIITADMVKEGATVIDFGQDVDFETVSKKTGLITPHIGGVGPIVIAAVLKNLLSLYKKTLN